MKTNKKVFRLEFLLVFEDIVIEDETLDLVGGGFGLLMTSLHLGMCLSAVSNVELVKN